MKSHAFSGAAPVLVSTRCELSHALRLKRGFGGSLPANRQNETNEFESKIVPGCQY